MGDTFANVKRTPLVLVLVAFLLNLALITDTPFAWLSWRLVSPLLWLSARIRLYDAEAARALNVLAGYWGRFLLIIVVFGWGICRLKPQDMGLLWPRWRKGLTAMALLWAAAQGVLMLVSLISHGTLTLHPMWIKGPLVAKIAAGFKVLLGVALLECVLFRGWMVPQFFLTFRDKIPPRQALLAAVALSQVLFAVSHIPHYSMPFPLPLGLLFIWLGGMLLAWVWIWTGNLYIAIGFHALIDYPMPIVSVPDSVPEGTIAFLGILVVFVWPRVRRLWRRRKILIGKLA